MTGVEIGVSAPPRLDRSGSGADLARRAATAFMKQVLGTDDVMRATGLSEVVVRDASLRILDRADKPGPALRISEANWLPLGIGRSKLWLQVVEPDGAGWDLTVERERGRLGSASVSVEIEDVPVATIAPELADADGGPLWVSTITLQARMAAGRDGALLGIRGALSTGQRPDHLHRRQPDPHRRDGAALRARLDRRSAGDTERRDPHGIRQLSASKAAPI